MSVEERLFDSMDSFELKRYAGTSRDEYKFERAFFVGKTTVSMFLLSDISLGFINSSIAKGNFFSITETALWMLLGGLLLRRNIVDNLEHYRFYECEVSLAEDEVRRRYRGAF